VNPNDDRNSANGLTHLERRFVEFNGALSPRQLTWLRATLDTAARCAEYTRMPSLVHDCRAGERVIVAAHVPIYPPPCDPMCLLWNYQACSVHVTSVPHRNRRCWMCCGRPSVWSPCFRATSTRGAMGRTSTASTTSYCLPFSRHRQVMVC
jgi:hypothetical protein